jgi:hypothetical protein
MLNFDLTIPEYAYMFGFFQADGHLYQQERNRGKLILELNKKDKHILYEFQKLIPVYSSVRNRIRDTNFKKNFKSSILSICDLSFRTLINNLGVPYGRKSRLIKPPLEIYSKIDYYRGLIDGDGSLGLTKQGLPFISLTTYSDFIAEGYKKFIQEHTGMINNNCRNKRDNIYNILMFKEDAQILSRILYPAGCFCLKRKLESVQEILLWKRPKNWKEKVVQKGWTFDQDDYIKGHTISDSMIFLGRSKQSITTRLWRVKGGK